MKQLNGSELAGFIKERQAKAVRGLRQQLKLQPKLAIIQTKDDPVIDTYVRLKKQYGADIPVDVDIHRIEQSQAHELNNQLNGDDGGRDQSKPEVLDHNEDHRGDGLAAE
mgnify:CR=1 FL=1